MPRALQNQPFGGLLTVILCLLLISGCRDDDDTPQGPSEFRSLTIHFTDPNDITQRTRHREVIYVSRQSGEILFCTEFDGEKTEVYEIDAEIGEKFNVWVAWIDFQPSTVNVDHAQAIEIVGYLEREITANEEWFFTGVLVPDTPIIFRTLELNIDTQGEEVQNLTVRTSVNTPLQYFSPGEGLPYEINTYVKASGDIIYVTCQNESGQRLYRKLVYEPGMEGPLSIAFSEFEPSTVVDLPDLPIANFSTVYVSGLLDDYYREDPTLQWKMRFFGDLIFSQINLADNGFDNYQTTIQLGRDGETHYLSLFADHLPIAFDFEDFTLDYLREGENVVSFQSTDYNEYAATWIGPDSEASYPTYLSVNVAGRMGASYVLPEVPACVLRYSSDAVQTEELILKNGAVHNYDIYAERANRFQRLFKGAEASTELYPHYGEERIRRFKRFE